MREVNYGKWNREAFALLGFTLGFFPFMAYSTDAWIALMGKTTDSLIGIFVSWGIYAIVMTGWYAHYVGRAHAQERRLISFNRSWRRYTAPTE
jgi:hypothetical protein